MMDTQHGDPESRGLVSSPKPIPLHSSHAQDPKYYFPDGSLVLLVEETLFKVHASVLGRESATFRRLTEQTDPPNEDSGLTKIDVLGETVFKIPGIKAEHFRNFLIMFYGLPTNQAYRALMSDFSDFSQVPNLHIYWHVYLDVAEVASRLMAPNLEAWARGQLRKVAKTAYEELSRYSLRMEYRLRALLYAKKIQDDELVADIRNATQLHFTWISKNSPIVLPNLNASALNAAREKLTWIFKYPNLQQIDPSLFGFAFCSLLGLGHEVWMNAPLLTREDRVMFLYGQVQLAPLPLSSLGLEWLNTLNVENQRGEGTSIECCSECNFYVIWEASFGDSYRQQLCADTPPLCGISQLAILPCQRLVFRGRLNEEDCSKCQDACRHRIIAFVDKCIQDTYTRLAAFCRNVE